MPDDLSQSLRNLRAVFDAGIISQSAFEEGLERLRTQYGAATVDALLRQRTDSDQQSLSPGQSGSIGVSITADNQSVVGQSPITVIGHTEQVNLPDPTKTKEERALRGYLLTLRARCRTMQERKNANCVSSLHFKRPL